MCTPGEEPMPVAGNVVCVGQQGGKALGCQERHQSIQHLWDIYDTAANQFKNATMALKMFDTPSTCRIVAPAVREID